MTHTDAPARRHRTSIRCVALSAAALGALALLSGCLALRPEPPPKPERYFGALQNDPQRAAEQVRLGIDVAVVGVIWGRLEPRPGVFDYGYVQTIREQLRDLRAAGSRICLDLAMQYPPGWVFEIPHSRFVNQYGQEYRDESPGRDFANGIFNRKVRDAQAGHVRNVFGLFGTDFLAVRMGWGEYGELCYPRARFGGNTNCFWAFDAVAQGDVPELRAKGVAPCPVPGWKPGTKSSGHRSARQFADWYIGALVDYQNWQIRVVRRQFAGPLQVMYPSWGLRPGAVEQLVADDLATNTQEIQRGLDYARLIRSLRDRNIIVYCTWMDGNDPIVDDDGPDPARWSPMRYLAHLAHTHKPRLEAWGENTANPSDLTAMELCFERVRRYDVRGLVWAFERNLYDGSGKHATIHDYARMVRALPPLGTGGTAEAEPAPTGDAELAALAEEAEFLLRDELRRFFPACVDAGIGGFLPEFRNDWTRGERKSKHIVAQARLTWTAAEVARRRGDLAREYARYALHGARFLRATMWDAEHGGFHWCLDENGAVSDRYGDEKHTYGVAFGIYAAANVFRATRDADALALAVDAYRWLEKHAHDVEHGGYFEALRRDGTPILAASDGAAADRMGTPYGTKSMNVQIHVLEALSELYLAWPDPQLRERLEAQLAVVRDRIVRPSGALSQYLARDWRPIPGPASFGHDVETAFLLLEATAALDRPDDARTLEAARRLVDHALKHGFDWELGGLYDEGAHGAQPANTRKVWWAQAEAANALVLLHELSGTPDSPYLQAFRKLWPFVRQHAIDAEHGGWFVAVTREGVPLAGAVSGTNKGADSKVTYHTGRAMLNVADRLRRLAAAQADTSSH